MVSLSAEGEDTKADGTKDDGTKDDGTEDDGITNGLALIKLDGLQTLIDLSVRGAGPAIVCYCKHTFMEGKLNNAQLFF